MPRFADNSKLIFDLGMNNGDDTAHYLAQGFKVVALDANPALCEKAASRFHAAISGARLTILNAAIAEETGEATFYVNLDNDHWSSLDIGWAGRDDSRCREINVRCVTLAGLFAEFGVPFYLKVDVEGVDLMVLQQLRAQALLPRYASVEDCRFGLQFIEILASSGYDAFKLLDQSTVSGLVDRTSGVLYPAGSSGPFGDDVPGDWLTYGEMVAYYSATVRNLDGERIAPRTQWFDIHCTNLGKSPQ